MMTFPTITDYTKELFNIISVSQRPHNSNKNNGTQESNDKAIKIKTHHRTFAKKTHDKTTDDCSDNPHNDIHHDALISFCFHNHRSNPTD